MLGHLGESWERNFVEFDRAYSGLGSFDDVFPQCDPRGVQPIVQLSQRIYETGVSITKRAFASVAARLQRSAELPRGSVTSEPQPAPIAHIP